MLLWDDYCNLWGSFQRLIFTITVLKYYSEGFKCLFHVFGMLNSNFQLNTHA